jgi:hypothetical protein
MENNNTEQHYAVNSCVKLGDGTAGTYKKDSENIW